MSDDVLKVIELAKVGKCTPEEWESLPLEIRQRILEIRVDIQLPAEIKVNHNVTLDVPHPAELGFKAGFGWTMGKNVADFGSCCFAFLILILIMSCPIWIGLLIQLLTYHH